MLRGEVMNTMTTVAPASTVTAALRALAGVTDPARAARAATVTVEGVKLSLNGATLVGVTARTGEGSKYATRISFAPRRGFHCTCPDVAKRGVACKHVAALAARVGEMIG
jgi:uncharacterized Zn finger protein